METSKHIASGTDSKVYFIESQGDCDWVRKEYFEEYKDPEELTCALIWYVNLMQQLADFGVIQLFEGKSVDLGGYNLHFELEVLPIKVLGRQNTLYTISEYIDGLSLTNIINLASLRDYQILNTYRNTLKYNLVDQLAYILFENVETDNLRSSLPLWDIAGSIGIQLEGLLKQKGYEIPEHFIKVMSLNVKLGYPKIEGNNVYFHLTVTDLFVSIYQSFKTYKTWRSYLGHK